MPECVTRPHISVTASHTGAIGHQERRVGRCHVWKVASWLSMRAVAWFLSQSAVVELLFALLRGVVVLVAPQLLAHDLTQMGQTRGGVAVEQVWCVQRIWGNQGGKGRGMRPEAWSSGIDVWSGPRAVRGGMWCV